MDEVNDSASLERIAQIRQAKKELHNEERKLIEQLAAKYASELAGKTGTVNVGSIKFSVPKQIKWNQEILAELWDKIAATNEDPFEYMTLERDVPESRYKAWPEFIKEQFEPARTVSTGSVTIKLEE